MTEVKQRLVIAGFHIDLRLSLDAFVDDEIQSVAFANGRGRTVCTVAEQPIDLGFIGAEFCLGTDRSRVSIDPRIAKRRIVKSVAHVASEPFELGGID